jgi:uncharacterized protein (TIGR02996 family)
VRGEPFNTRGRSEVMIEERAFLKAVLERPDDDARKLVYADWLEEQGDPRAEYLRLMMQVRQERVVTAEQRQRHTELSADLAKLYTHEREAWREGQGQTPENRERQRRIREAEGQLTGLSRTLRPPLPARLQELAAALDPNWLAAVSDPVIEGCGKGTGGGWRLRFDLVCDQSWADMTPTDDTQVRHCDSCGKNVYFCDNLADAREHAEGNHCIAVDLGIPRRDNDLMGMGIAGRPSKEFLRQCYEQDVDPVSQARLDARERPRKKRTRRR